MNKNIPKDNLSSALSKVPLEINNIERARSILFKHEAIYVPIFNDWRNKTDKLIGVIVFSRLPETMTGKKGEKATIITKSMFFRELINYSKLFFNSLILDLKKREKNLDFEALSKLSKKKI